MKIREWEREGPEPDDWVLAQGAMQVSARETYWPQHGVTQQTVLVEVGAVRQGTGRGDGTPGGEPNDVHLQISPEDAVTLGQAIVECGTQMLFTRQLLDGLMGDVE